MVWKPILAERNTLQKRVLARDRGFCQVPGCSRAATQAHHIDDRSAGGADEPWNLVSLCAAHHLHGVHLGYIRVSGRAPHGLRWQLGVRLGAAPLVEVVTAPPVSRDEPQARDCGCAAGAAALATRAGPTRSAARTARPWNSATPQRTAENIPRSMSRPKRMGAMESPTSRPE